MIDYAIKPATSQHGGWMLMRGRHRLHGSVTFPSVTAAKLYAWQRWGVIAMAVRGGEVRFNPSNLVHAALARIEAGYRSTNQVVAVAPLHYLIRRSTFGVEVQVTYRVDDKAAYARRTFEPL